MSDAPKFKTFRDLRSIPVSQAKEPTISTSTSSIPSKPSIPSNTSIPRTSSITSTTKKAAQNTQTQSSDIAPVRDFQKVPNSVTRAALPQGIFRGKSKQVWDYLWSVSRGAIKPTRMIRKSRKEIKEGSGLGSMVTVDAAIEHLIQTGLLKVRRSIGSLTGNEYEIFTPEEAETSTSISSISSNTSPIQNLVHLDIPESSNTSRTQTIENKSISGGAKTSFKTNINDDDTLALFFHHFDKASRELTGKGINPNEGERWGRLAELLILELHAAARHTQVSSVPSFLTEHLRRKLLNVPPAPKSSKVKSDTVGKTEAGDYEIKPLDEKGREAALAQLREFAGEDLLQDFKKWYTEEDWMWLLKELKK